MQQPTFPCSRCGHQNYIGQPFCQNCGQQFQYNCPSCRAIVDSRFSTCPNCRTPLNWPQQQKSQPVAPAVGVAGKKVSPWLIVCFGLIGAVILIGGGIFAIDRFSQGTPSTVPPTPTPLAQTPEIEIALSISPTQIDVGDSANLSWNVINAIDISIDNGIGLVLNSGTKSVNPAENTTYTLIAINDDTKVSKSVAIDVVRNINAKPIALTISDVESAGFVFVSDGVQTEPDSISAYNIEFLKNNPKQNLNCSVEVFPTKQRAQKKYNDVKYNNKDQIGGSLGIGQEDYYVQYPINDTEPVKYYYGIRFYKNNVCCSLQSFYSLDELASYSQIMEQRILSVEP